MGEFNKTEVLDLSTRKRGFKDIKMPDGKFDDGREDKSDFLARMFMMGKIQIDEKNKTMFSTSTSANEETLNTDIVPREIKNEQYLPNPIQFSSIAEDCL